ncbi:hypothetical protein BJ912DRAFT_939561 [Pholiota molesta]|nr:hypothetical protein BJ912DRAFT_939561 [Pholiota molesta]
MLSIFRSTASRAPFARGFATTRPTADLSKLTLVGTLVREPETRATKNDKEYCVYVVATRNQRLPPNANGAGFEMREPEPGADPSTPFGQRQIFLRHETFRLVHQKPEETEPETETATENQNNYTSGY